MSLLDDYYMRWRPRARGQHINQLPKGSQGVEHSGKKAQTPAMAQAVSGANVDGGDCRIARL